MYRKDDTSYFIVDAHIALWDARPENQRNIHGKQFIDCFYDYHRNLSPESEVWSYEEYLYQGGDRLMKDLFTDGYVDHAIFQPAYLGEFYYKGFGQTEEASELAAANPDKLTYNHNFDPRNGEAGMDQLRLDAERFGLKGVKLYTAEWHGDSRGWRLDDPGRTATSSCAANSASATSTSTRARPSGRWIAMRSTSPTSTTSRRTSPT